MKFYKRYPGDIGIKTGDLTLAEFGAYDRLLDHFYSKELPIRADRVYSVCRTQTKADRDAVDRVLQEFFTLTDDGWVQQRAEQELAEALPRIEAARANGKKGGRPKKPTGFSTETQGITQTGVLRKAHQKPESSSPTSKFDIQNPGAEDGGESVFPPRALEETNTEGQEPTPAGMAWRALREAGIADGDPGHPGLQRLLDAGVTPEDLVATARTMLLQGKGRFALLLATVEGRMRDAAAATAIPPAPEVPDAGALAVEQTRREQAAFAALPATKPPAALRELLHNLKAGA